MVSKKCPRCNKVKSLNDFYRDASRKDGRSYCCKSCKDFSIRKKQGERLERWYRGEDVEGYERQKYVWRERQRIYLYKHPVDPEKRRISRLKHLEKRKQWYEDLKVGLKCEICGEDCPDCLVFHHRDPKEKEFMISTSQSRLISKKRVLQEIRKCKVLCANCHLKLHNNSF